MFCCRSCCLYSLSWFLMHKFGIKTFHWWVVVILSLVFAVLVCKKERKFNSHRIVPMIMPNNCSRSIMHSTAFTVLSHRNYRNRTTSNRIISVNQQTSRHHCRDHYHMPHLASCCPCWTDSRHDNVSALLICTNGKLHHQTNEPQMMNCIVNLCLLQLHSDDDNTVSWLWDAIIIWAKFCRIQKYFASYISVIFNSPLCGSLNMTLI